MENLRTTNKLLITMCLLSVVIILLLIRESNLSSNEQEAVREIVTEVFEDHQFEFVD